MLRGQDTVLHRTVALKVMRPEVAANPLAKERFLREARAMAALEHPRVVVVHQIGEWRGTPFLVMPLMKGCSLGQRIKHGPPVGLAEAVRFAREAAEGLAAAHARGLVHRDVKPDNLWLEETPDGVHVRVLDFGLVRDDGADPVTCAGTVFGTPSYMAPEQAAGERVDGRADLFSLGCVLYELVTGARAFRGDTLSAVLYALANHHPPAAREVNPEVTESLSALIEQLLAKHRDGRPSNAKELVAALKVLEGASVPTRHEKTAVWMSTEPPSPTRMVRGRRLVVVLFTLTVVSALGLTVVTGWPSGATGTRGKSSSDDTSQSTNPVVTDKPVEVTKVPVLTEQTGVNLPPGMAIKTPLTLAPAFGPMYVSKTTGMKFVRIPKGRFTMGSPKAERGRSEGETEFEVTITNDYYLGAYEVTQKEWRAVMGKVVPWEGKDFAKEGDDYPANWVCWDDAVELTKRLAELEGVAYRLPSEAEWEYACRAGVEVGVLLRRRRVTAAGLWLGAEQRLGHG